MKTCFTLSGIIVLCTLVVQVQAHGYCSRPPAKFIPGPIYTTYVGTTTPDMNKGFDGGFYKGGGAQNTEQFNSHFAATGFKDLRAMIDSVVSGCGNTDTSIAPIDVSGFTEVWWQNNEYQKGFLHNGPCMGVIGDTTVFSHNDCIQAYTGYPAKIPVDYSVCKEKSCMFTFYWIALHQLPWQIYKNCVPITNGNSRSLDFTPTPNTTEAPAGTVHPGDETPPTSPQPAPPSAPSPEAPPSPGTPPSPPSSPGTPPSPPSSPGTPPSPPSAPSPETPPSAPSPGSPPSPPSM